MANLFPLQLGASETIVAQSELMTPAINTTEAWLNFQAMGIGWFGDETKSPRFRYRFVTLEELQLQCNDGLAWQHEVPDSAYITQNNGLNCLLLVALPEDALILKEQIAVENVLRERLVEVTNARAKALNIEEIRL